MLIHGTSHLLCENPRSPLFDLREKKTIDIPGGSDTLRYLIFMTHKLGLVCISELLKDQGHSFQTMTRKKFNSLPRNVAIKELSSKILHNAHITAKTILHCSSIGISHYRVSSNLFPLVTDETLELSLDDLPDIDKIKSMLMECGNYSRKLNISLSSHPDQFNVLASYDDKIVERTIKELNHQANVLDMMGCPADHSVPMCLHIGLSPNLNKETVEQYIERFINNFSRCSPSVQKRLVLENEDKGFWNCENLKNFCCHAFPLVYDNLHDACNPSSDCFQDFKSSWGSFTPVFHWSEGIDGSRSHADYSSGTPKIVIDNLDCVWEVELKQKDKCILKILEATKH